jgi:hypothetical protein
MQRGCAFTNQIFDLVALICEAAAVVGEIVAAVVKEHG